MELLKCGQCELNYLHYKQFSIVIVYNHKYAYIQPGSFNGMGHIDLISLFPIILSHEHWGGVRLQN